jgi:hypothetical protein
MGHVTPMKDHRTTTALGDALSKRDSKSSCIGTYTPVSRRISPRGTCDTLAVGQIAGAGASGHSRPGCFATPCHARTGARYVLQWSL